MYISGAPKWVPWQHRDVEGSFKTHPNSTFSSSHSRAAKHTFRGSLAKVSTSDHSRHVVYHAGSLWRLKLWLDGANTESDVHIPFYNNIHRVPACARRGAWYGLRLYQLARRHHGGSRRGCENAPGAAMIKVNRIRFAPVTQGFWSEIRFSFSLSSSFISALVYLRLSRLKIATHLLLLELRYDNISYSLILYPYAIFLFPSPQGLA